MRFSMDTDTQSAVEDFELYVSFPCQLSYESLAGAGVVTVLTPAADGDWQYDRQWDCGQ